VRSTGVGVSNDARRRRVDTGQSVAIYLGSFKGARSSSRLTADRTGTLPAVLLAPSDRSSPCHSQRYSGGGRAGGNNAARSESSAVNDGSGLDTRREPTKNAIRRLRTTRAGDLLEVLPAGVDGVVGPLLE